jgi:ribosomal protein S18 acetylase RimI-like enzyme
VAVEILSTAFMDDPISRWIFPDDVDRARKHPDFFGIFIDVAMEGGEVHLTDDHTGVAVWLDVDPAVTETPAERAEFRGAFGRALDAASMARFLILDDLMSANHPGHAPHAYMPFVGVRPEAQDAGVGTALLRHRIAGLEASGRPAYLEASSPTNRRLYSRLGFEAIGESVPLPDGPRFHPMWRRPVPA